MNTKLIFMHLPKCGGTTFHSILERMYLPEEIFDIKVINHTRLNTDEFTSLSIKERDKFNLIKGHQEFGLHKYFSGKSEYVTFLRNPIDRIISYYFYVKRRPNHRLYKNKLFNDEMNLYDFVTKLKDGDIHNGQIRFISGIADKADIMLEKAIENIDNHFSFVGTLQKFDESLIILQKMYGWSTPYYGIGNKTKNRPKIDDIDQKTIDTIKELNHGDIILYEKITNRLDDRLKNEANMNQKLIWFNTISKSHRFKKKSYDKLGRLFQKIRS